MPIRCHAQQDARGVMLTRIETLLEADALCIYFGELGLSATLIRPTDRGAYSVHIDRLTLRILRKLIKGSEIELIKSLSENRQAGGKKLPHTPGER